MSQAPPGVTTAATPRCRAGGSTTSPGGPALTVDTIRYYQREGLLPAGRAGRPGQPLRPRHLERLDRIRELQARRFSLAAIRALLGDERGGSSRASSPARRTVPTRSTSSSSDPASTPSSSHEAPDGRRCCATPRSSAASAYDARGPRAAAGHGRAAARSASRADVLVELARDLRRGRRGHAAPRSSSCSRAAVLEWDADELDGVPAHARPCTRRRSSPRRAASSTTCTTARCSA